MRIGNIQDCKNCKNSSICGESVQCESDNYFDREFFKKNGRYCANDCKSFEKREVRDGLINQKDALNFLLAGKSEFVLHSTKTNEDFKFTLTKKESFAKKESFTNKEEYIYFVNIIIEREKIYAGHIKFDDKTELFIYTQGKRGQLAAEDRNIRSLMFVINKLFRCEIVGNLEIYHVGRCGRCGKKLTTPESILTGLGPTCSKNLGIPRKKIR